MSDDLADSFAKRPEPWWRLPGAGPTVSPKPGRIELAIDEAEQDEEDRRALDEARREAGDTDWMHPW